MKKITDNLSAQGQVFLDQLDKRSGPGTPANPTMEYYLAMRAWMLRMEAALDEAQKYILDIQVLQRGQTLPVTVAANPDTGKPNACSNTEVHLAHLWGINQPDEFLCLGIRL